MNDFCQIIIAFKISMMAQIKIKKFKIQYTYSFKESGTDLDL